MSEQAPASERAAGLGLVCLAISSFKTDHEVLALLESARGQLARFARVLVVDSLGSGVFPSELHARGLAEGVEYHCFPENLGSAGNLERRLALAAATGARFVYALNHDGELSPAAIERLVELAQAAPGPLGAVYPLRRMTGRASAFDVTGRYRFPFTAIRSKTPPAAELNPVFWSSSNGALYDLTPARRGLLPLGKLWMGYEDLAYGWLLHRHGYRQFVARDVCVDDSYEYRKTAVGHVTAKPSWYAYYYARNLLLAARETQQPLRVKSLALSRVLLEFCVTAALRSEKRDRLAATWSGLVDGLRGRGGKWRRP